MKPKSEVSQELYQMMLDRGYQERFCDLVTQNLNTDFTAHRIKELFPVSCALLINSVSLIQYGQTAVT